jgi:hypothetical protein
MREVVIIRIEDSDEGTWGVMVFGQEHCRTLELPWRNNRRQVSCIPPGRYRCVMRSSSKFGRVYQALGVPDRSGILFHSANLAGDVRLGWSSQLQGCIAPFDKPGRLRNNAGEWQRAGLVSRPAVTRLNAWGGGQPFDLLIRDFAE